jgi:hypothetical protein
VYWLLILVYIQHRYLVIRLRSIPLIYILYSDTSPPVQLLYIPGAVAGSILTGAKKMPDYQCELACITQFYCILVELRAKTLRAFVPLHTKSGAERLRASCRSILAPFICIYQSVPPNDPLSV